MTTTTEWRINAIAALVALRECDGCGYPQTRVWTDSWSGKSLCNECLHLHSVGYLVTDSPENGDNLNEIVRWADEDEGETE